MLNELAKEIHQIAKDKGWWFEERNSGELIALMHSELSEALEELRNGTPPNHIYFPDYEGNSDLPKPEGVPVELADVIIRILDFCGRYDINMEEAIKIKMEYNKTRPNKHGKIF